MKEWGMYAVVGLWVSTTVRPSYTGSQPILRLRSSQKTRQCAGMQVQLYVFLIPALDEGSGWHKLCLLCLRREIPPHPINSRLFGRPSRLSGCFMEGKISGTPARIRNITAPTSGPYPSTYIPHFFFEKFRFRNLPRKAKIHESITACPPPSINITF